MSRLTLIDVAQADPKAKVLLEKIAAARGRVPNIFRAMAHSPAALQAFVSCKTALAGGSIRLALQEKIGLLAAEINRCEYCICAHVPAAQKAGIDEQGIADARAARSTDPFEHAVLQLAAQVLRHHGHVSDAQFAAAKAAGLTDAQITDVVAIAALNIFTNYFNDVAGTEIDFPRVELNPPMQD
jgi:uncharacterized peroxidase-related enzyme